MSIATPILIIPIITNWESVWLPMCILAVMASVGVYNLLLMIGRAFSVRELESYAKSELLQSAANGFMAIFLILMLGGAMEIAGSLIEGEVTCGSEAINIENTGDAGIANGVMNDAYEVVLCRIQEKAVALSEAQEQILGSAETWSTFAKLDMQASIVGITFFKGDWNTNIYQKAERLRIANNLITSMLITLNAQMELITYIKNNMLGVFIPLGILLRNFYFTRGPGALMIALGIGMYYIFPVFYVLLDPGFVPATPELESGTEDDSMKYCYPTMSTAVSVINTVNEGDGGATASGLSLGDLESELSTVYTQLILQPLIAFFLTMVFVRYIMMILGADTTDLTKMISKVI